MVDELPEETVCPISSLILRLQFINIATGLNYREMIGSDTTTDSWVAHLAYKEPSNLSDLRGVGVPPAINGLDDGPTKSRSSVIKTVRMGSPGRCGLRGVHETSEGGRTCCRIDQGDRTAEQVHDRGKREREVLIEK